MIPINKYSDVGLFDGSIVSVEWPEYYNLSNPTSFGLIEDRPGRNSKALINCFNNTAVYFENNDSLLQGFKMRFANSKEINKLANDINEKFKLCDLDGNLKCCNWDDIKTQFKKRFSLETEFIFGSNDSKSLISMLPKELIKEILSKSIYILPSKSK